MGRGAIQDAISEPENGGQPEGQQDGFEGFILLGDAHSGKVLGVVPWESEEAMRASEEAADRMRGECAHATGAQIAGVERYEVRVFEVSR